MIFYTQSNDTILLIVDRHFWKLRETNIELVFENKDLKASNSSDQWSESNFVFAHPLFHEIDSDYRGVVFFDELKVSPAKVRVIK